MKTYLLVGKFGFTLFLNYPLEFFADIIKRVLQIVFIVLFWSLVIDNNKSLITIEDAIIYFILVQSISDIVMAERLDLGTYLTYQIKSGALTNILTKPINKLLYIYSYTLGEKLSNIGFAIIGIGLSLAISHTANLLGIFMFLVYLIIAVLLGAYINIFIATVAFYIVDTIHLRFLGQIVIRIFSGAFVPLSFFAESTQRILDFTPFPYLAYKPVSAFSINQFELINFSDILVGIIWVIVLYFICIYFWKFSLKSYEAVGQ